jgi:hypothetical protein
MNTTGVFSFPEERDDFENTIDILHEAIEKIFKSKSCFYIK